MYLNLQGNGGMSGLVRYDADHTVVLCVADQKNCCDNCVSPVYPLNRPLILTIIFCTFISASQSTLSCRESQIENL